MPRLLVVGDVIDDVLVRPVGPVRTDTDTVARIERRPGGSAANVAAWLGVLGATVEFVGTVAHEDVSRHTALLEGVGVRTHLIGSSTPTGTIVLLIEGEVRTMLTERGANVETVPSSLLPELVDAATHLHLTGYSLFRTDEAPWRTLLESLTARGATVSVDPSSASFLADYGPARFLSATSGAAVILPNLEEGRLLTGASEPRDVADALLEHYPIVALTLGPDGALVATPDGSTLVPAVRPVPALVDPTGAGDSFAAAFLSEWTRDGDPVGAARTAVEVAARAVSAVGARPSSP